MGNKTYKEAKKALFATPEYRNYIEVWAAVHATPAWKTAEEADKAWKAVQATPEYKDWKEAQKTYDSIAEWKEFKESLKELDNCLKRWEELNI